MAYSPALEVSDKVIEILRKNASSNAFAAAMLDVVRRKGGLTQAQLDMIAKEFA